jgi:hypothetical protein
MKKLLSLAAALSLIAGVGQLASASMITSLRALDFHPSAQRIHVAVETGEPEEVRVPGIVENKLVCVQSPGNPGKLDCFEVGELVCPGSIIVSTDSGPVECDVDCHGQTVPDSDGACECDILC